MPSSVTDSLKVQNSFRAVSDTCGLTPSESRRLVSFPRAGNKICELSGTHLDYQKHVVRRLLAGEKQPFEKNASSLAVYETVSFKEVNSRLRRAWGKVRREAECVEEFISRVRKPDRLADRMLTLDLIVEQVTLLVPLLSAMEIVPSIDKPKKKTRGKPPRKTDGRLEAATALGLIAKNIRNVTVLRQEHRPTNEERHLALDLCRKIKRIARSTLSRARQAFGQVDDACRVRPRARPVFRVITHSQPDADAIVAAWLAERFLFAGKPVEVLFVELGRVLGAYRPGDCLVDVGGCHDPAQRFFDHKPPALPSRHDSCAATLVWDYLCLQGHQVGHLESLILDVHAVSRGEVEHIRSCENGCHAALERAQEVESTDAGVYRSMRQWLNRVASH